MAGNGEIEIQFRYRVDGLHPSDDASAIGIINIRRLGMNQFIAHGDNVNIRKVHDGVAARVPAFEVYGSKFSTRPSVAHFA